MSDDRNRLEKILDCIGRIDEYIKDGKDAFWVDYKTQDAVIRNCQVIGDAVKDLDKDLRDATPEVDWQKTAKFRDRVTHDYLDVDLEIVWRVIEEEYPTFKKQIKTIHERLAWKVPDQPGKQTLSERLAELNKNKQDESGR